MLILGGTAMSWDRSIRLQADPGGLVYRGFAVSAEAQSGFRTGARPQPLQNDGFNFDLQPPDISR